DSFGYTTPITLGLGTILDFLDKRYLRPEDTPTLELAGFGKVADYRRRKNYLNSIEEDLADTKIYPTDKKFGLYRAAVI
ncbi:hypothetical protein KC336_g18737, partial [Hortaea werneckii]